jgi:NAD(P)-dependent dehydrogenase (short-subunit alcohol dehydrogenase family)
VRQLLAKENTVIAAVRSPGTATALQELQQQHPPTGTGSRKLHITTLDVSNPKSITTWASSLRDKCPGLRHLDVVINNAGGLLCHLVQRTLSSVHSAAFVEA